MPPTPLAIDEASMVVASGGTLRIVEADASHAADLARLVTAELHEEAASNTAIFEPRQDLGDALASAYLAGVGVAWLAYQDDVAIGYVSFLFAPIFGTKRRTATLSGYFVDPLYRHGSAAFRLWRVAERWFRDSPAIDAVQGCYAKLGDGGSAGLLRMGAKVVGTVLQLSKE